MDAQLKQLIDVDVQAEFVRLAGIAAGGCLPPEFSYGNLERNENDAPPKIAWSSPSGQFDPGKGTGGVKVPTGLNDPGMPPIGCLVARIQIWIWAIDSQACWDLFRLLVPAIRNKVGGPNHRYREYREDGEENERWLDLGRVLTVNVDFDLYLSGQVPNERALRAVSRHTHNVSVLSTTGDSGSNPLT